jgi:hypothetical protein
MVSIRFNTPVSLMLLLVFFFCCDRSSRINVLLLTLLLINALDKDIVGVVNVNRSDQSLLFS